MFLVAFFFIVRRMRAMRNSGESYTAVPYYDQSYVTTTTTPSSPQYPASYGTTEQTAYVSYDPVSGQYVQTTYHQTPQPYIYQSGGSQVTTTTTTTTTEYGAGQSGYQTQY